ncbi:hypothetical protein HYV31_03035 [candidate division WWE3 bacterium]|nr:hypothetical protein [candidate division WWE3 bacterium]
MPTRPAHKSSLITRKRKASIKRTPLLFNRKTILSLKKTIFLFSIILVSALFIAGVSLYKTLNKSMANAQSMNSYDIKDQDIVSLLLVNVDSISVDDDVRTNAVDLVLFDITMKKVVTFKIPLDLERDLPGRFGLEKYQNTLKIGALDGKDLTSGITLLKNLVKRDFGFNVDKVLVVNKDIAPQVFSLFESGQNGNLFDLDILSGIAFNSINDLQMSEMYELYTFVHGLTSDRFITHDDGIDHFMLEDFTDKILRDLTFDSAVAREEKSFAIMNGTNISGVATFGTRLVKNIGGHVIATESTETSYAKSVLVADGVELASVKALMRFFNIEKVISKNDYHGEEAIANRADVMLIVGFDIAETL